MIKTREDSRIEIWTASYINIPSIRTKEDEDVDIIQIERGVSNQDYIVEVVEKKKENNNDQT